MTSPESPQRRSRKDLPPLFWYMESGDWEKATERVRRHPREVKTWATLRTKSLDTDGSATVGNLTKFNNSNNSLSNRDNSNHSAGESNHSTGNSKVVTTSTKRLALHHACFKLRGAGSLPPPRMAGRKTPTDPFVEVCRFILMLIRLHPDAAARRESRHGCLPLHLAAFASCVPRASGEEHSTNNTPECVPEESVTQSSGTGVSRPKSISYRGASDATTETIQTNMSAVHAEESYAGGQTEKQLRQNHTSITQASSSSSNTIQGVSVSMRSNIVISAKREEMLVQVINALLDAYPKAARVDSEGGRLPLHTACAGRATPRVISTLITAYPAACRQRNKDGFLPLHLSAHWGVSHPAVAVQLLRSYPDATVGRNRWERTPLEEALCMAGENGRPHQAALVRALRKHPSYWTRPNLATAEFGFGMNRPAIRTTPASTAVDVDESLPSNDSTDENDDAIQMTRYYNQARNLMDEAVIDEDDDEEDYDAYSNSESRHDEAGMEVTSSPSGRIMHRLSPRGLMKKDGKKTWDPSAHDDVSNMSLCTLIEKRKWKAVVARIRIDPLSAERELKVMTRGGFMASTGMSPLHYACERKPPVEVVRSLIEAFPFAVLTRAMPGGCLPLHIACTWGASPDVVQTLLSADHGSVKVKDELGNVALHSACFSGADARIIKQLLAADGKSVVGRNHQGSRPIDICKRLRHDNRKEVAQILTRKKEEVMRAHRRSRSSGLLADIAKEADEMNRNHGVPTIPKMEQQRAGDLDLQDFQAVEVTYDDEDKNTELLWI